MKPKYIFRHITLTFFINVNAQSVHGSSRHCVGGYDPICYFLEDEHFQPDGIDPSIRDKRSSKRSAKTKTGAITAPPETSTTTESPDDNQPLMENEVLTFNHLEEIDIAQPKLKQYSTQNDKESYPPWTYRGFYSPADWHKIPSWYFGPKLDIKAGKFTHKVANENSGISFMEFSTEGMHSKNCSASTFPAPLDIIPKNAKEDPSFVDFNFVNYDINYAFIMFLPEDGTDLLFVKLQTPPNAISKKPSIDKGATTGSPLTLDRILIHYGSKHTEGSEHRINGKTFGMELQFFFNLQVAKGKKETPYYTTLMNYIQDKDTSRYGKNLLVLCILVEVAPNTEKEPPPGKTYNKGMKYLAMGAQEFWATRNLEKFRSFFVKKKVLIMKDFFEEPRKGLYYTYHGTLTHPPCFNNTRYSVFEKPLYMSHKDWQKFLFIPSEFSDTTFVAGNFRPMEVMTLTSNYTNVIVPYDKIMKLNLSYTIRKSRRATAEERMSEYDYYENSNLTESDKKNQSTQLISICTHLIYQCMLFFLSVCVR